MSRIVRRSASALVVALVVALAQPAVNAAPGAATAQAASQAKPQAADLAQKRRKGRRYKPGNGVVFNNPLGGPRAHRINRKVMNAIDHAPRGSVIRVMSWNIMSRGAVNDLLRAQARGVKVKVLMADLNATEIENPHWERLKHGIWKGNRDRRKSRRSLARLCVKSCRGPSGQAHAKYFLFSKTGRARHVFMQGSANLTTAGAINQWNDLVTSSNTDQYRFARDIFEQMVRDEPVDPAYVMWSSPSGRTNTGFFPLRGSGQSDPVMDILRTTKCKGATNTKGGRTQIRVAPDVMRHERGFEIAHRLRRMYKWGCDIKIGYTVMGVKIFRHLRQPTRRGRVPMRHLVQDFNGDGEFDRYFHLKAMAIKGNVGGNPGAYVAFNGSGNFSGVGAASDENFGIYYRKRYTKQYFNYIDYWFENYPDSAAPQDAARTTSPKSPAGIAARHGLPGALSLPIHTADTLMTAQDELVEGVDPYAQMEH